ncbi:hypothetical protein [Tabrizicola sp.]|uniref:hypothetical protein n=1 Tax=Tabrizicola sp. TaxID=2005166 RepID=UPI0027357E47|nr:hypothetical protein [Tabrizicola sp.]MDP3196093.1 hypothetical protein [Tabrizicola sp.]
MLNRLISTVLISFAALQGAFAQDGTPMTTEELTALTADGVTLTLGGAGMGYTGELALEADGTATGGAKMDNGNKLSIAGTWAIKDGKFCRTWTDLDGGKEVCETWVKTSDTSVEVYNGDKMLGVNSW